MTTTTTATTSRPAHLTGWDRAAVLLLGAAGCALSFSALQQMALAIHIRPHLTYLFPVVIDGFIAYGVRALLVLRCAPLRARLYVWMLFGTATAVSVWANALHAVRLNEDQARPAGVELRLGDPVVAVLSTVAPLALAGAVHLYILISRHPADPTGPELARASVPAAGQPSAANATVAGHPPVAAGAVTGHTSGSGPVIPVSSASLISGPAPAGRRVQVTAGRSGHPGAEPGQPVADGRSGGEDGLPDTTVTGGPVTAVTGSGLGGHPVTGPAVSDRRPVTGTAPGDREVLLPAGRPEAVSRSAVTDGRAGQSGDRTDRGVPVTGDRADRATGDGRESGDRGERPVVRDTAELLAIARSAVRAEDKLTRKVVAEAIRGRSIPLSNDTMTALMAQLRQHHHPAPSGPGRP
jgi:hypothetical protein